MIILNTLKISLCTFPRGELKEEIYIQFDLYIKAKPLVRFTVQVSLKDNLVDPSYQMKYFIIPLFFTFKMGNNVCLAYYREHSEASDDTL